MGSVCRMDLRYGGSLLPFSGMWGEMGPCHMGPLLTGANGFLGVEWIPLPTYEGLWGTVGQGGVPNPAAGCSV